MKCNEFEKNVRNDVKSRHHNHMSLDNLDKALHDLGMLSAITEARRDYLRDSKSNFSMMRVSKVNVGHWFKRNSTKHRLCPYVVPVRHRTKSENSDVIANELSENSCDIKTNLFEPSTSKCSKDMFEPKSPAKRCQSLENLNLIVDPPPGPEISPDMDCVSTQIQKLQVDE